MKKQPVAAPEVAPAIRSGNFDEVVATYSKDLAREEASRCLQCKNPACISGCPVGINIKKFIAEVAAQKYQEAYFTIREKNNFPAICGRVCPAEYQCRRACVLTKKNSLFASPEAINIHFLERFVGDFGRGAALQIPVKTDARLSRLRVAVVGCGPAGLCCAGELARHGVAVVIYEALHKPGGVLRYGIPPFRLPGAVIDAEVDDLKSRGVEIVLNTIVGKTKLLSELWAENFSAVFLGLGAGTPSFLGIPGEGLANVYSANEFLSRVNLMGAYRFPEYHTPVTVGRHIVVIGGGNTAMDAARVAVRLQKQQGLEPDTTIVYRRTENEMPARRLEIAHAKEEGVQFRLLVSPQSFGGRSDGAAVETLTCAPCELGEPDASGRRKPIVSKDKVFTIPCDQAVVAVGLTANQILIRATPGLQVDPHSDIVVDPTTMQTSLKAVYAGGDVVGGEGTVIEAMGMAKKAAGAIVEYLLKNDR